MVKLRILLLLSALLLALPGRAEVSRALLDIHERLYLEQDGGAIFSDATVYEPVLVEAFYESRDYQTAWTDAEYARQRLQLLKSSEDEGLNPADYHYDELLALGEEYHKLWSDKDYLHAKAEVLLTDGVLLYARHLIQGKADPSTLDRSWNYARRNLVPAEVARNLAGSIANRTVAAVLEGLKPDTGFYALMKQQLKHYGQLAEGEQFSPIPEDVVLHPGDRHRNVPTLRKRLKQMVYLGSSAPETDVFDAPVQEAVRQLQRDHDLDVDGVVGKQSYQVLNLSFSDKVDRLRINMDRVRWISEEVSDDYIVVNIAGYELYYMRNRQLRWETPVMVGTIDTRTPIFQARLRYLEFNPTWNTPRSLIMRNLFPRFKANPRYAVDKYPTFYPQPQLYFEVTADNVDTRLSEHFTLRQFLCKQESDYPKYVILKESLLVLLEGLVQAVQQAGYPVDTFGVISGYRTPYYNRRIGNVPNSRHVYGDAMDLYVDMDGVFAPAGNRKEL